MDLWIREGRPSLPYLCYKQKRKEAWHKNFMNCITWWSWGLHNYKLNDGSVRWWIQFHFQLAFLVINCKMNLFMFKFSWRMATTQRHTTKLNGDPVEMTPRFIRKLLTSLRLTTTWSHIDIGCRLYQHPFFDDFNQLTWRSINQSKAEKAKFKSDCLLCQRKYDAGRCFGNKSWLLDRNGNAQRVSWAWAASISNESVTVLHYEPPTQAFAIEAKPPLWIGKIIGKNTRVLTIRSRAILGVKWPMATRSHVSFLLFFRFFCFLMVL